MSKRRTKKEKIIASLRRQVKIQQRIKAKMVQKIEPKKRIKYKKEKAKSVKKENIFGYDPSLINKDLKKTTLLSVVFTIIILGIWLWQQNNWWLPKV